MAKNNIRRLPVVNNGVLVGILTSSDVLMVSPELTEILVERLEWKIKMEYSSDENSVSGGHVRFAVILWMT